MKSSKQILRLILMFSTTVLSSIVFASGPFILNSTHAKAGIHSEINDSTNVINTNNVQINTGDQTAKAFLQMENSNLNASIGEVNASTSVLANDSQLGASSNGGISASASSSINMTPTAIGNNNNTTINSFQTSNGK